MGVNIFSLVLYIDDILLATNDICLLHDTKIFLSNLFEMKDLSGASFILGIEIVLRVFLDYHKWAILIRYLRDLACRDANHMTPRSLKETSSVSINAHRITS